MIRAKVPVLQIVHYSDMHLVGPNYWRQRSASQRFIKRLPASLRQGVTGADRAALLAFADFLEFDIARDPIWKDLPTWLIDTGDGTTFGDDESLDAWLDVWSPRFLSAAGPNAKQKILYGNHDAWPGVFPLQAPRSMGSHRADLRIRRFKDTWPDAPLTAQLFDDAQIQLYVLNSVDHDLMTNTKALGNVLPDRHWESPPPQLGPTAADGLRRLTKAHGGRPGAKDLRILAMHYPVCDAAASGKRHVEILSNRYVFAGEIAPPPGQAEPLSHIVISGHTHEGFPALGLLPNGAGSSHHKPLATPQLQFVTPSLCQINTLAAPATSLHHANCLFDFPYQCTVLRFYAHPATPEEVSIERTIAGCQVGGAFGLLPVTEGSQRSIEEITLVL